MALGSDEQSLEAVGSGDKNASITGSNATQFEPPEEESEDEDVDFNPFLKESLSEEASSSLSSEVEVLDAEVVDSHGHNAIPVTTHAGDKLTLDHIGHSVGDDKGSEQDDVSQVGPCDASNHGNDSALISELGNRIVQEKEFGCSNGTDGVEDAPEAQETLANYRKPIIDLDDEDAICKRTRARYSLAGFTLDELETFLQETDDEDDIQNVDEEEVYRKFLAAVLQGENEDNQGNLEGDEDDDNDADFEIEIEEALESDIDDCPVPPNKDEDIVRSRRPETRQNRRQKGNVQNRKKLAEKGTRPLRPLLPVMPSAPVTSAPCVGSRYPMLETSHFTSSQDYVLNGFTSNQIGQLYSLVYEHVQLLVQIYSLCVLEPSRQHIASEIKGLLSELLHKRDLVLAWRKVPYPNSCFLPPHVQPSTSDDNRTSLAVVPVDNPGALFEGNDGQGCRWLPSVSSPVLSVLDVAPLKLAGKYIDDVSNAVREHQRRCVETTNIYLEKQPLFPLSVCPPLSEVNCNVSRGTDPTPLDASTVSPNSKVPKKTLAATLVESTKKQSVALVPRQVSKLAQGFCPLFNPALFPHKPPSSAVANRVLFTDTEDELLAMGMMEYNHDWKAIQQRFLPCKSEHQIFVRAKNRCSSNAPENPIKAVRKMKTSPLTEEEKARIHEGLKTYKLDWTSIWKFIVPYRDPNLLCRQWRIAIGTQKCYKASDPIKKERRRMYESNRRKNKATALKNPPIGSEKEDDHTEYSGGQNGSSEDYVDNDNEAYLHEAFLADWRPTSSEMISSKISASNLKYRCPPQDLSAGRGCEMAEGVDNQGNRESQSGKCRPFQPYMPHGYPPSKLTSKPFVCESLFSHRTRMLSNSNLVKLAPELPPVKLPPAVRVIPQASLRGSQLGTSNGDAASGSGLQNMGSDPTVFNCASNLVKHVQDTSHSSKVLINSNALSLSSQKRGPEVDPQMHPLLFRTLEEGHLPCYPLNSPSRIPTFSFFPGAQHQINASFLRNSHPASHMGGSLKSSRSKEAGPRSSNLDFHPLLQRNGGYNANPIATLPPGPLISTDLELSRDGFTEGDTGGYHARTPLAQMAPATRPSSSRPSASDLDLNINPSSSSRKRKISSRGGAEINPKVSFGLTEKSGSVVLANLDAYSGGCMSDNIGNQPLAEIVMEQEELSDSEEEMEGVEFECEEMADSEGEDTDSEQIVNAQNKEQQLEPAACGTSEQTRAPRKGRTSDESDLAGPGNGSTRTWLSLDSLGSQSHCSPHANKNGKKATLNTKSTPPGDSETDRSHPVGSSRKPEKQTSKILSPSRRMDEDGEV